ncbi:MAG TPA: hypothetical protein VHK90_02195 [Thermoanaerobaculia bacterium]|nr:hypothetical protein [Thermoanaerobaculia bacterium]
MIVLVFAAAVGAAALLLLPVTTITAILCARIRRYRWIAEIATTSTILTVCVLTTTFGAGVSRGAGTLAASALLVLLGVYWWALQATEMVLRVATRAWRSIAAVL